MHKFREIRLNGNELTYNLKYELCALEKFQSEKQNHFFSPLHTHTHEKYINHLVFLIIFLIKLKMNIMMLLLHQ